MERKDLEQMASAYQQVLEATKQKLDPVNKKAVKKDFDDRKDKDIDNDGDVDSSDEYLHNRRKAVSKAVKNEENIDEAPRRKGAPKMTGDSIAIQRAKDAALNKELGRTKTGRKKPERTMTSTQRSLASLRKEAAELEEGAKEKAIKALMTKALGGKRAKPGYTSAVANNGDFVVKDGGGRVVGRIEAGKFEDPLKEANLDEVLDSPGAMARYRKKADDSGNRARNSATRKILKGPDKDGKRADHSDELKTMKKRNKGQDMADRVAARQFRKSMGLGYSSKKEEVELEEAMDQKKFSAGAKAIKDYAQKNGGVDKKDFMEVSKLLDQIGRVNILQAGQLLSRLNRLVDGMDTDVRERIFVELKKVGLVESVNESNYGTQAQRLMSPLQKARQDKEKRDRDRDGKLKSTALPMRKKKNEEAEIDEAKNYEIKNGKVHISKANFRKVHKDYKNATPGKERMSALDPKSGATTSFPVVFTEEAKFTDKQIKMAIGIASDKRYAKGNMTGAVTAINKIEDGLSDHPKVRAVLKRQNESINEGEMTSDQKKKREEIVLAMKDREDEFKDKYGERWKEVMYATATKMAMKGEAVSENRNWAVYRRILENRAMQAGNAIPPESQMDANNQPYAGTKDSAKKMVDGHGGLMGIDSGIDGAKAAEDTAKNAAAGVTKGMGLNRPNDNKQGD